MILRSWMRRLGLICPSTRLLIHALIHAIKQAKPRPLLLPNKGSKWGAACGNMAACLGTPENLTRKTPRVPC
ncbi:hypothetical protein F5883DRAFT_16890 [Diaporthe sp. PMI_573]|nr:hypothetical protein F5883DRAFT_16890 [Diaporthaceae sp. PMI_573]